MRKPERLISEANKLAFKKDPNAYKLLIEAAEIYKKKGEAFEYRFNLAQAVNLMLKNPMNEETLHAIEKLRDVYIEEGQFSKLGKLYEKIASLEDNYEVKAEYFKKAIESYELCQTSHRYDVKLCKENLADLHSFNKNYSDACYLYYEVENDPYYGQNLISSKFIVKYILCILATEDVSRAKEKLKQNCLVDSGKFLKNIIKAIENNDVDFFSETCYDFNEIKELDALFVDILLHIKTHLFLSIDDEDIS